MHKKPKKCKCGEHPSGLIRTTTLKHLGNEYVYIVARIQCPNCKTGVTIKQHVKENEIESAKKEIKEKCVRMWNGRCML